MSQRRSLDRPAPLALKDDRLLLAFQADNFSDTWSQSDPDFTDNARSQILLASVDTGQARAGASEMGLAPLAEPATPFRSGSPSRSVRGRQPNAFDGVQRRDFPPALRRVARAFGHLDMQPLRGISRWTRTTNPDAI